MSRDYAKTPKPKNPHSLPGWLWMLGGLIIGLFIALLVYINENTSESNKSRFSETVSNIFSQTAKDVREVTKQKQTAPAKPSEQNADKKPRFDFYTILPELEIAIPEQDLIKLEKQPASKTPTEPGNYILQVGSFKQSEQADQLKARLALQGVEASIQSVAINNDTWHRVRIGPIHDLATLNQIRKRLQKNGIASIVVKNKS
ncbi:MAG: SPOR domain-containing protein [Thioalkalispiraceae bacterium]|jgi:cell division protein FtsN